MGPVPPPDTVAAILDHALAAPPLLGGGRLVCIDGPAGSGKTTLGQAVAEAARHRLPVVHLLHTDDLLEGWGGMSALGPRLRNYVVGPLASGHPARYRRYDWLAEAFAEEHVIEPPVDLLVLDGVGTGHRNLRSRRAALVWVEADDELRLARGMARDGEAMRARWLAWMAEERRYFARHGLPALADVRVDEAGRLTGKGGSAGRPGDHRP